MVLATVIRQTTRIGKGWTRAFGSTSCLSNTSKIGDAEAEKEHREARAWLARFNVNSIPKGICDISFSRASGPGGQNVNKYISGVIAQSLQLMCVLE